MAVFGDILTDLAFAAVLGAVGGFGLSILQEGGLLMPRRKKESGKSFADLGFIADLLVGALAAMITYSISPPTGQLPLFGLAITSGLGGKGILSGYTKATEATQQKNNALKYRSLLQEAVIKGGDANTMSNLKVQLEKTDKESKLI